MPGNPRKTIPKKPMLKLDEKYPDASDLELQVRSMLIDNDTAVRMVIYAWLSDERKRQNKEGKAWGWQYCPFDEGDKVMKIHCGHQLTGKITSICRDYYDGDCLVLYVTLDKKSSKKWIDHVDAAAGRQTVG